MSAQGLSRCRDGQGEQMKTSAERALSSRGLLLAGVSLVLALSACPADGDPESAPQASATPAAPVGGSATPSEPSSPTEPPATQEAQTASFGRIPGSTRRDYFASTTDDQARATFPCERAEDGPGQLTNLVDFDDVAFVTGDFSVIRRAVLFADAATTKAIRDTARASLPLCGAVTDTQVSNWSGSTARFLGIKDDQTVVSQTRQSRKRGGVLTVIDIVSTEGNAVVWTRIGSDITVKRPQVTMAKVAGNAGWIAEVRQQGAAGLELLQTLKPSRR